MARFIPKCILIDLSGTIHVENEIICGVESAIKRLKESGLRYRFVTNSSKESTDSLHQRLNSIGLTIAKDEVFTSLSAARRLVVSRELRPLLFLENSALDEFKDVETTNPNAVVVGLAPTMFHYEKLTEAFNTLSQGAELIAVNKSRYFQRSKGLALGAGAFVAALEYSTDKTASIVGKPSEEFFRQSIADFDDVNLEDCVMIGDDARDDVGGAQQIGMKGILVKTGKYRDGDERKITPAPFMTMINVCEAIDYIISLIPAS